MFQKNYPNMSSQNMTIDGMTRLLEAAGVTVNAGEIVALLGSNGAGKSTLNNNLSGLYRPFGGTISFDGQAIAGARSTRIVEAGLVQVPEGRRVFPNLSVRENLELGSYRRGRANRARNFEHVLDIFPRLRELLREQLRQSPRLVRFSGLHDCVKRLVGASRWGDRCRAMNDQIVGYLRQCLDENHRADCALVVS